MLESQILSENGSALRGPSLRQIANALAVSTGTVSRALAYEGGVGEQKARQIRDYAARMGYRPKPMRRRNTRTIAVLATSKRVIEPEDPFQAAVVLHLCQELAQCGWHALIEIVDAETRSLPRSIWESRVEGIIMAGAPSRPMIDLLLAERLPTVVLEESAEMTGLPCVMGDVHQAMRETVERLLDSGHRRFGFVYSDIRYASVRSRYEVLHAMVEPLADAEVMAARVPSVSLHQGQVATRQLLSRRDRPTVIIYINDLLAVGGLLAIRKLGLDVPDDVSIMGHDNTQMGMECEPSISSVDVGMRELARNGVQLLVQRIATRSKCDRPEQKVLHANVIWRNSCGPAPA